jgi:eukaryotic-like serine/threonine-protein kinase
MNAALKDPVESPRAIGRYYLHGLIGAGGMATVHLGWRHTASRIVAIKRLRAELTKNPDFVAMFADEARLALRIVHRNVVSAIEVVEADGESFLVMEYVPGGSLSQLSQRAIARGESVPPAVAAGIVVAILQGLHATHEAKDDRGQPLDVVHRDVSPQNMIVGTDGTSRLLDFGVADAAGNVRLKRAEELRGKIHYMAPEQLNHDGIVSRRTDLYSAAIVLWEALSGRRLFKDELRGEAPPAASGVHRACVDALVRRYGEIPAASTLVPGVSRALDDVILRGLDPAPSKRFATADDMARAIAASGLVASEGEIAAWVQSLDDEGLAARAQLVRDIERSGGALRVASANESEELPSEARARSASRRWSGVRARDAADRG